MPVIVGFLAGATFMLVVAARAQQPCDDLTQKQLTMLAAEAQFFSTLARQQKDELDKLKANANPCKPEGG
jgi:hypothetical protein